MSNDLVILERQMAPLVPRFAAVLGPVMPPQRLVQTLMISCERTPKLLTCDRQSLFNGAMTFAVLGLEVDGATGQAFLIPFQDRRANKLIAQPVIGYKGYNTMGARSGLTIMGGIVREGDEFDYAEGTKAFVHHKKKLGGEADRRIIAAWATAASTTRPATVKVLSIDDLMAVKEKSPRGREPPWADPKIGFPAMCAKTAKRRLSSDIPLTTFQRAAVMEEAFEERGLPSCLRDDGAVMIDGEVLPPGRTDSPTPAMADLIAPARGKGWSPPSSRSSLRQEGEEDQGSPPQSGEAPAPSQSQPDGDRIPESGAGDPSQTVSLFRQRIDGMRAKGKEASEILTACDDHLAESAKRGTAALKSAWGEIPAECKEPLKAALDRRHKATAAAADQQKEKA